MLEFSVVVCTHNRAGILPMTLDSLCSQDFAADRFEVLIVDNCSSDGTREIAERYGMRNRNFGYHYEPIVGLSHARNAAVARARAPFLAFLDDDAKAPRHWLTVASQFVRKHPEVPAFGGGYVGFTLSPKPAWYPPEFGTVLLGIDIRPLAPGREFLSGNNMFLRKSAIVEVGGFNSALGMRGNEVGYGEETRVQKDLFNAGHAIYYLPELTIEHLIADHKLSLNWLIKANYAAGRQSNTTLNRKEGLLMLLAKFGHGAIAGLGKLFTPARMPLRRRCYYALAPLAYRVGALAQVFDWSRESPRC